MKLMRLFRNNRGSSTVDFAFALPVLLIIMMGMFQLGQYLHAAGAIRHALGEGIRLAKVDTDADSAAVQAEVYGNMGGLSTKNVVGFSFSRTTTGAVEFGTVVMKYKLESVMPLVPVPDITITQTKTAYIPA